MYNILARNKAYDRYETAQHCDVRTSETKRKWPPRTVSSQLLVEARKKASSLAENSHPFSGRTKRRKRRNSARCHLAVPFFFFPEGAVRSAYTLFMLTTNDCNLLLLHRRGTTPAPLSSAAPLSVQHIQARGPACSKRLGRAGHGMPNSRRHRGPPLPR